jgi:hypothetical protein
MSTAKNRRGSAAALCTAIVCLGAACRGPVSHAPIIEHYRAAACIPFSVNPKATLHTREWDTDLALKDGSKVIVTGAQMPGGRINVRYPTSGRESVAADAGDYVYPSDVRLNAQKDRLYVKASGLAAGIWQETWLFEYDLHSQKLVDRRKVANEALPAECPELSRVK